VTPADSLPAARVRGRPLVIGVVNVTPDSFSDGGAWFTPEAAVSHGRDLASQGADLLDVGGESTRPGAERPSLQEELRRVVPVVEELSAVLPVSVDTMRPEVAEAALDAGAVLVNDVSGGLADRAMAALVAERGVPFVAMHWRGHSADMQARARYDDVVAEVAAELSTRVEALVAAGIRPDDIVVDPGLGFAKLAQHNWELLRRLDELKALGHRVLLGTSRKGFLGLVGRTPETVRPPLARDVATAATSLYAAQQGVWAVRVHDVSATVDALDVADALRGES
jgi:dihydropteroate synthase